MYRRLAARSRHSHLKLLSGKPTRHNTPKQQIDFTIQVYSDDPCPNQSLAGFSVGIGLTAIQGICRQGTSNFCQPAVNVARLKRTAPENLESACGKAFSLLVGGPGNTSLTVFTP